MIVSRPRYPTRVAHAELLCTEVGDRPPWSRSIIPERDVHAGQYTCLIWSSSKTTWQFLEWLAGSVLELHWPSSKPVSMEPSSTREEVEETTARDIVELWWRIEDPLPVTPLQGSPLSCVTAGPVRDRGLIVFKGDVSSAQNKKRGRDVCLVPTVS